MAGGCSAEGSIVCTHAKETNQKSDILDFDWNIVEK